MSYAVFRKSEGSDGSVIAGLLSDLEGVRPAGVLMLCDSKSKVERIARLVLDQFNISAIKLARDNIHNMNFFAITITQEQD
jgi:hypothetical protein